MRYTIPDYYKEFQCTADACEDTCCAGWQIAVDKKSMEQYKNESGPYRRKLDRVVNWQNATFRQDKNLRCGFLNADNLCDMYANLGRGSLCRTCRLYPRHIEEFEGVREITLSVSCPEVAGILLRRKEPVQFLSVERGGEEEYEEFDPFLYSQLLDARDVMLRILQNRELAVAVRVKLVLGIAHDMQNRIDARELFACQDVLGKYQTESAVRFVEKDLATTAVSARFAFARRLFFVLEHMELLREDWYVLRREAQQRLYGEKSCGKWARMSREFTAWMQESDIPWEIQKEQLMVYFISTYFCGAVYDGRVYGKVQLAAASVILLEELLKARFVRNEKALDLEDVVEIVYRYSREIEHSDLNIGRMEKLLAKNWEGKI
ncbi:flagellin lysine-N-methylase [Hespellia stercorisuis]|uniref:Lysine-N-methylase n=1 Tax=Hespellia stercorisuis DSM 15480 TaxID=1121950 RepID=A0A1M6P947_9FIRM|nr:flagellin lysine-N-methylase [Hespellia stercorisuis]SHK04491.1 lysine-N-methylase [Hespellia stercorisuis DSM 15480]